jgi:hypothetical protein
MIAEALIVSAAAVLWKSFSFAKWLIEREDPETARRKAIAEKRRVIERDRKEWWDSPNSDNGDRLRGLDRCDKELKALADEEANDSRINEVA